MFVRPGAERRRGWCQLVGRVRDKFLDARGIMMEVKLCVGGTGAIVGGSMLLLESDELRNPDQSVMV